MNEFINSAIYVVGVMALASLLLAILLAWLALSSVWALRLLKNVNEFYLAVRIMAELSFEEQEQVRKMIKNYRERHKLPRTPQEDK